MSVGTGAFLWQAVAAVDRVPGPTAGGLNSAAVVVSSAVLVFREGLEAILVLAAVTAGLARSGKGHERGVVVGSALALLATVVTWFLVVAVISEVSASELHVQAATGLLAIVVLLVVMNWFFHKIYWTGWIAHHDKRRRRLLAAPDATGSSTFRGLALLGFTAIYREGFEVVLFLQNLRLKAGTIVVMGGAAIGVLLTTAVAALTFIAHRHLPYKRMLVLTGVLLGGVLVVMVGESAQEMQQAGWLTTTAAGFPLPEWVGMWFALFPTVEGQAAQALAVLLVIGSYVSAQFFGRRGSRRA